MDMDVDMVTYTPTHLRISGGAGTERPPPSSGTSSSARMLAPLNEWHQCTAIVCILAHNPLRDPTCRCFEPGWRELDGKRHPRPWLVRAHTVPTPSCTSCNSETAPSPNSTLTLK